MKPKPPPPIPLGTEGDPPTSTSVARVNISMKKELVAIGQELAARQHFGSFSEYIAHLIREDWDRGRPTPPPPQVLYPTAEQQQQLHAGMNEGSAGFGKLPMIPAEPDRSRLAKSPFGNLH